MVIQLPEWDGWRISGDRNDWQIQTVQKDGKNAGEWRGIKYFNALEWAVNAAYEKALKESPLVASTLEGASAECKRIKDSLARAVRKAVKEAV